VKGPGGTGTLSNIVALSAGTYHSVALTADGHVDAFGDNANGQLGNGTTTSATTPVQVKGTGGTGLLSNVQSLSAGFYFSEAVTSDGHVSAWGQNNYGQLANGTTSDSSTPVTATGIANVSGVAAGGDQTLAIG
jgi:alpha-tubulin suppressor-like RCC1 family protein